LSTITIAKVIRMAGIADPPEDCPAQKPREHLYTERSSSRATQVDGRLIILFLEGRRPLPRTRGRPVDRLSRSSQALSPPTHTPVQVFVAARCVLSSTIVFANVSPALIGDSFSLIPLQD